MWRDRRASARRRSVGPMPVADDRLTDGDAIYKKITKWHSGSAKVELEFHGVGPKVELGFHFPSLFAG